MSYDGCFIAANINIGMTIGIAIARALLKKPVLLCLDEVRCLIVITFLF